MQFSGLTTAVITPFKEGQVDEKGLRENIWVQIKEGADALLALGSTGEGNSLSEGERRRVVETAVGEAKGKIPVMVSTGDVSTRGTIEKSKEAERLGAEGLLVIAPYYVRPSQEGLIAHFSAVAAATSLPIILYNHPTRTGVSIEVETVKRLSEIENIVGIKDASGSIAYGAAIMHALPQFLFLAGDDLMALPFLSIGGDGLVSVLANLFPRKMKALVDTRDITVFNELYPYIEASQVETNPVSIKAMMEQEGFAAGECRLPLIGQKVGGKI